jgi:hypothetical protein
MELVSSSLSEVLICRFIAQDKVTNHATCDHIRPCLPRFVVPISLRPAHGNSRLETPTRRLPPVPPQASAASALRPTLLGLVVALLSGWQRALAFVQPRTVIAWQKKRFRDHWRRLSQSGKPGRPTSIGKRNAIFLPPSRPPAAPPAGGHPSLAVMAAAPGLSSNPQPRLAIGTARQCAVWTCGSGWDRMELQGFAGAAASLRSVGER